MISRDLLKSAFLGSMIGTVIGDAIGELAFRYRTRASLQRVVNEIDVLKYTDDTAMAIGIAEVLCECKDVESEVLGKRFKQNFEREPDRGYGPGPQKIFSMVEEGYSFTEAAGKLYDGKGSYGNGAAMRIAPVGLYYFDSPELVDKVYITAEVTHTHPLAKDGAAVLATAIAEVIKIRMEIEFNSEAFFSKLYSVVKTPVFFQRISNLEALFKDDVSVSEAKKILGTDVTAPGSVPFAIYCFLKCRDSFNECLYSAVLSGGDRDTIGAMACAISGAWVGIKGIPSEWIEKLENLPYIIQLTERLFQLKVEW